MISFDTPWKQRASGFLMFSVGIKRDQWYEMGCKDKVILYKAKKKSF